MGAARAAAALAGLVLACATGAASPAGAAPGALVGMEDERLLLSEPAEAPGVVAAWRAAGVRVVRLHARWGAHAPGETERRRPTRFVEGDHTDAGYDWARLDTAISLVRAAGMDVMLTVTGPGPLWSSRRPSRGSARYRPDPVAFARFAGAVATRYGTAVDRYLLWNEPNQGGWLEPQFTCRRSGRREVCTPESPHLYRALVRAGGAAIERADPGAELVIGELAPIGRPGTNASTPIAPLPFLRAFGCVDARFRPLRKGPCKDFEPAPGDAIGHHPHPVRNAPTQSNPDRDTAQLADLGRLVRTVDGLAARGRIATPGGRRLDIHLTEFGYQTSAPDHAIGIPVAVHARYVQLAGYLAWKTPRVRTLVHYQWRDEPVFDRGPGKKGYAGWQSGLRYIDDRPKPAMSGFLAPLVLEGRRFWGQVRSSRPSRRPVRLQRRRAGGTWVTVAATRTGTDGYWTVRNTPVRGATYRAAWGGGADLHYGGPERRVTGTLKWRGRRIQAASIPSTRRRVPGARAGR